MAADRLDAASPDAKQEFVASNEAELWGLLSELRKKAIAAAAGQAIEHSPPPPPTPSPPQAPFEYPELPPFLDRSRSVAQ